MRLFRLCSFVIVSLHAGCGDETASQSPDAGEPLQWFVDITAESGLDFVHTSGATGNLWLPEIMGGGVGMFDFDNDGLLDLYFVNGNDSLPVAEPSASATDRLYRQNADGSFTDVTEASGMGENGYGMGVAVGDIDNDGHLDVFVTNLGPDQLYRNNGDGTFENVTAGAGINVPGWSCSATFVDVDRDGFLDLYITQYVQFNREQRCYDATGRLAYCSPSAFPPARDVLLRNNGDGTFTDISEASGVRAVAAAGLGVVAEDFDNDGWPDIYVANDGYANNLWINRRDGTFKDVAVLWGAAYNMHGRPEAGMGVIAADFRDVGLIDLFMTHLTNESNTLYVNRGDGSGFEDSSAISGLATASMPWTGFGVAALDTTLDGRLDIVVANGKVVAGDALSGVTLSPPWHEYAEPNLYFRNEGNGRFSQHSAEVAAIVQPLEISRGLAVGDLNNDGGVDVVIANIEGPPRLYRNVARPDGNWLIVRATDAQLRRDAIGARITVQAGQMRQMRTVNSGYSYLSASDLRAHFGLGNRSSIDYIEVRWPDGLIERFTDITINQVVELVRGEGEAQP